MKIVTGMSALLLLAFAQAAGAQAYPNKPIRFVVPFPTGGGGDYIGTTVAKRLTEALKQPVVVENRGGGAGVPGTEIVAKASPDGFTLLLGQIGPMSLYPALAAKPAYDPVRDFTAISRLAVLTQFLVAHPSLPAGTVQELVALAKSKPGQLHYGSGGAGGGGHVATEWLKSATGINVVHVPFEGAAASVAALVAGKTSFAIAGGPAVLSHVRSGKLKALAVGSSKRWSGLANVPTVAESGVAGFEYSTWYALFAPAKTPKEVVGRLNSETVKMLKDPETVKQLASQGADPTPSTPEQLAKFMREDQERWKKVIKTAGIKL